MSKPIHVAELAFVETGERRGLMIAITRRVKPGDRIVTAGQLKIDDGSPLILSLRSALMGAQPVPHRP